MRGSFLGNLFLIVIIIILFVTIVLIFLDITLFEAIIGGIATAIIVVINAITEIVGGLF